MDWIKKHGLVVHIGAYALFGTALVLCGITVSDWRYWVLLVIFGLHGHLQFVSGLMAA